MGLTVDNIEYTVFGNKSIIFCDVDFDASYLTGGEELLPGTVRLTKIETVNALTKSGYLFEYDYTNQTLKAFYPSAAEESHTHAVALDTGATAAGSAHQHAAITAGTPAGSVAAPVFTGSQLGTHQHDALTAGTPAGTNAASVVTPGNHATIDGVTVGTPKLTDNDDPPNNLAANALYIVEAYGVGNKNIGVLQSNCAATANVVGAVDDVSGICGAATPRFFITHNASPSGVALYVDEADNDKLVFISPTTTDAIIIMPFEAIADGVPGYAYAITVHHKASMSGATALYFDDNAAADAQLIYTDTGNADGVIYASDITVVAPQYTGITGNCGSAAAQVFSGSQLATHQHAAITAGTPAGTNNTPAFTGSQLATHQHATENAHTHGYGSLADAASGAATGTAGVATEVGSGDNLSSLTNVKLMIVGY